jgi:hypothetical protein
VLLTANPTTLCVLNHVTRACRLNRVRAKWKLWLMVSTGLHGVRVWDYVICVADLSLNSFISNLPFSSCILLYFVPPLLQYTYLLYSHVSQNIFNITGNTTWQNLFPCLLNTELNRDYFTAVMPEELISDLVYMVATASVQEVSTYAYCTAYYTTTFDSIFSY